MGAYLSKPVTEKTSLDCSTDTLTYGLSEMQGWRRSMEDAHIAQHALSDGLSMFAVFDGHGGTEVRATLSPPTRVDERARKGLQQRWHDGTGLQGRGRLSLLLLSHTRLDGGRMRSMGAHRCRGSVPSTCHR